LTGDEERIAPPKRRRKVMTPTFSPVDRETIDRSGVAIALVAVIG
jgi:hypothetical protein